MKSAKPIPEWQVQTAKARFSELFRKARTEGPQLVSRQGKEAVVVIPVEEYEKLSGKKTKPQNLHEFFRQSPLVGVTLKLERDKSPMREIEL